VRGGFKDLGLKQTEDGGCQNADEGCENNESQTPPQDEPLSPE
jgi:hypothetical protein